MDGFDPNANGAIRFIVTQPDGKLIIVGDFTALAPNGGATVTRNHIARLNPDGSLDTGFNPNPNGVPYAIALQPDGRLLVGGAFTSIGGQPRTHLARLNAITGLADAFNPTPDTDVLTIAVQTDGKILVGGNFTNIAGQTRNYLARLNGTTGLADSFDPKVNPGGSVNSVIVQPDGKILIGGVFGNIGGQMRSCLARLDPGTGLADSFAPNADDLVLAIAVQADGKVLASGFFNSIGGKTRSRIARLDATTGLADSFDPNVSGGVFPTAGSLAVQPDGKILVGGSFTNIGGQARNGLARLHATTGLADSFNPNANGDVYSIAVQSDGKILAGGNFTTLVPSGGAALTRNGLARLETDGRLDRALNPFGMDQVGGQILTTAVQPDGKILIGGDFTTVLGATRNNIARLNTDGTLDTVFNPNASSQVGALAVQADGKILAGGSFNSIGGKTRNFIARLDATTGAADSFNPNANNSIYSLAVQPDGKVLAGGFFSIIGGQPRQGFARLDASTGLVDSFNPNTNTQANSIVVLSDSTILVGGGFTMIGGQVRNRIGRLNASTGLADSLNPNANGQVYALAVQVDGQILAGGDFSSIGGQARTKIARLDASTGLADSFNPSANDLVTSIAVQADARILAAGPFTSIGGQPRKGLARLDATTGAADLFDPNANDFVNSIAVQADGKILVGGFFTSVGGQTRTLLARVNSDVAALQSLTATPTNVTWMRGGSSQQFTRVTFESSTDSVNYTPLGNGIPSGSNWILNGLNLPIGQNLYLRARGYYGSGFQNGSQSIQESVRNVYLVVPVLKILSITRSADGHIHLQCLGVRNQVNNLQVSPDLSPGSFAPIVPSPLAADDTGVFAYDDAVAAGLTKRFYRLAFP